MTNQPECLYCGVTSHEIPLISVTYQEKTLFICSQHLPLLIHEPGKVMESLMRVTQDNQA